MSALRFPKRFWILMVAALAAGMMAALLTSGPQANRPPELKAATHLPDGKPVTDDFRLTDHRRQAFDHERLEEGWHFLFFGYTHCPDVCPMTLTTMNQAWQRMVEDGTAEDAQVVFVSVDPKRDTVERLDEYVGYFNDAFLGVTGEPDQLHELARDLGIVYAVHDEDGGDDYLVDHSAAILLIGPDGRLQAMFGTPHDAGTIAEDFRRIRRFHEARG